MNNININKISDIDAIRLTRQNDPNQVNNNVSSTVEDKSSVKTDKVEFSQQATAVGKLVDQVKQFPDVRQDIVTELQVQVSAGEYHPTNDEIAHAILKDEVRN